MTFHEIHEFVVLAQCESFHNAAILLGLSTPSLSKHIKAMEAELGVPLFARTTRRVALTEYGQIFLANAMDILSIQAKYTKEIAAKWKEINDRLTIGAITAMSAYGIPDRIADFRKLHPGCFINIIEGESHSLESLLMAGRCDCVFMIDRGQLADSCVRIPFFQDRLSAILPQTHPLANEAYIDLAQLRDDPFLLFPLDSFMHGLSLEACRSAGFEAKLQPLDEDSPKPNGDELTRMAYRLGCVSLLMNGPATYNAIREMKVVQLRQSFHIDINLIHRKDSHISPLMSQFLRFCGQP